MKCPTCGFEFTLTYPTRQRLKAGHQASVVKCPVCTLTVCRFDEEARPAPVHLHNQF